MKRLANIKKIDYQYNSTEKLFNDFSLQLHANKIYGLLGGADEGKSTILKLISGLVFPTSGEINVLGFNPSERDPHFFQNLFFLPKQLRIAELSTEAFEKVYAPFYPEFSSSQFYKNMNALSLDTKTKNLSELSISQKKKFLIAFGLATNARIILLDEPTSEMDLMSKAQFKQLLANPREGDGSILIATQHYSDMDDMLDTIFVMQHHKIILKENILDISQKLHFQVSHKKETSSTEIYSETRLDGDYKLYKNTSYKSERVDLLLFMNALNNDKESIVNILSEK